MMRTIAVLITCFNRREKTLACLRSLAKQELPENHRLKVYLVDDGCTDGTGDAVKAQYPETRVIQGTGSLYWAGGMRLAWSEAAKEDPDYFLLFNDDTEVVSSAISSLLDLTGAPENRKIAVAAIADPVSGNRTYGAQHTWITPSLDAQGRRNRCNTFNANCVLLTRLVYQEIGMLSDAYTHGMADADYGYRAYDQGIDVIESKEYLAFCPNNPIKGTWQDRTLPIRDRWQLIQKPTGLPWKEWLYYCQKNLGVRWPLYFISPYLRILTKR